MTVSILVAIAENNVIGDSTAPYNQYSIPWRLSADLRRFRLLTTGHTIIMGRNTFEISVRRALPNRRCIIITHQPDYQAEGCEVVHSLEEALAATKNDDEVFVIGGRSLFQEALPLAQKIYLTLVHASPPGDTFFHFDLSAWRETSREDHPADEKNHYSYSFIELAKK